MKMKKKRRSRRRFPMIVYALSVMALSLAVFAGVLIATGRKNAARSADAGSVQMAAVSEADVRVLTGLNEKPQEPASKDAVSVKTDKSDIKTAAGVINSTDNQKTSMDEALRLAEEEEAARMAEQAALEAEEAEELAAAQEAAEQEALEAEEAERLAAEEAERQAQWEAEQAAMAEEEAARQAAEEAERQARWEAEQAAIAAEEAERQAAEEASRQAAEEAARQAEEAARQAEEAEESEQEPAYSVNNDNVSYSGDYDYSADAAALGISGGIYGYSQEECYLLACTISAEVGWSPYDTQNAVANVILDRAANNGSIRAAVFAAGQFAVTWDGALLRTFRNGPMAMAITAAQDALNGVDIRPRPYYYFNNRDMGYTGEWIGDEYFYLVE